MSDSMMSIPLGFRFDPTDEELVRCYLYPRIVDPCLMPWDGITDREVYGKDAEPWKVFSDADDGSPYHWHSKVEGGYLKKSIYVFTNLVINKAAAPNSKKKQPKKNPKDKSKDRASRIAGCGKWAGQTGPKEIMRSGTGDVIGCWRMLTFECNKREDALKYSKDVVGHWIMHEYSLNDPALRDQSLITQAKSNIVLCKITKWIEIKNNNNNKRVGEVEAVQYYSNSYENLTGGNHYHVNCNNKRSVGEEIIEEEEELGNCNKKLQKTSSSSSSSSCFDHVLDHDLQQLEGWENNIDMQQLIADFESNIDKELIEEEDLEKQKTSPTSNSSCLDDELELELDYNLQQLVENWDTTAMDQLIMADFESNIGATEDLTDVLAPAHHHHNVSLISC